MSRVLPRDAEAGGGLMVAVIQFAITLGAGGGGLLYDRGGHPAAFGAAAMLLIASGLVAMRGVRPTLKAIGRAHVA
jgi:predicted MFS family arabinose efflux permease